MTSVQVNWGARSAAGSTSASVGYTGIRRRCPRDLVDEEVRWQGLARDRSWSTASVLLLVLPATLLADEPTPCAVDENMSVALIAAVVVADFPVHPSGPPIVFVAAATND